MPAPGGGDDVLHIGVVRFPTQNLLGLLAGGHQNRRISRTAALLPDWDRRTGNLPCRLDDFPVGKALPVAQVKGGGGVPLFQIIQRQHMGVDEILHMDIIPNAGAVGGGIVGAKKG
jgi:hypothetical protein